MTKPNPARLRAEDAVLVVVDLQERLMAAMPEDRRASVTRNAGILLAAARALGVPVLATEQYPKGLGPTIPEIAGALGDARPIDKLDFSACGEPRFREALSATGRKQAIVVGVEAHVCVFQTVVDLVDAGLAVHVPADAVASRTEESRRVAEALIREAGGVVTTTEAAAFQLVGRAGTDAFKIVSKLVK
ncbi:MAG: hydrolase [Candidatus Methylomirabilis sp.]|nr:hydrolase [Deltaproteobacteria bacterium]